MILTTNQLRTRQGGYGRHIEKMTDFRRKETVACFYCRGPLYFVMARFCSHWRCEKCGEVRAIQTVQRSSSEAA